jgi:hypothetical protein
MSNPAPTASPPAEVTAILRLEGLVALAGAVAAYAAIGGSWWLFAVLVLAPDLSMLGMLLGPMAGSRSYNVAHSYAVPAALGAVAWFTGAGWLLPVALIWVAHIGMDRALGYGLKFPGRFDRTHLGAIGKAKQEAARIAHAG